MSLQENQTGEKSSQGLNRFKLWLKRIGVAGFLFFLIKGLVWIAIFLWAGKCALG